LIWEISTSSWQSQQAHSIKKVQGQHNMLKIQVSFNSRTITRFKLWIRKGNKERGQEKAPIQQAGLLKVCNKSSPLVRGLVIIWTSEIRTQKGSALEEVRNITICYFQISMLWVQLNTTLEAVVTMVRSKVSHLLKTQNSNSIKLLEIRVQVEGQQSKTWFQNQVNTQEKHQVPLEQELVTCKQETKLTWSTNWKKWLVSRIETSRAMLTDLKGKVQKLVMALSH